MDHQRVMTGPPRLRRHIEPHTVGLMALIALATAVPPSAIAQIDRQDALSGPTGRIAAFADLIDEAARRFGLPPSWVRAVMRAESAGDPRAVSPKGAVGLMQITPATYARLRTVYGLGADPFAPADNIFAGAAYLRELADRYGVPGFLGAYNAGPLRYDAYLIAGRPLPAETRAYMARLAPLVVGAQTQRTVAASDPLAWRRASLFVGRAPSPIADAVDMPFAAGEMLANTPSNGSTERSSTAFAMRSESLFAPVRSTVGAP